MSSNNTKSTSISATNTRETVVDDGKEINTIQQLMQRSSHVSGKILQQAIYNKMIHNQTFDRIEAIRSNKILQQAMKEDYVKFVKHLNHMQ